MSHLEFVASLRSSRLLAPMFAVWLTALAPVAQGAVAAQPPAPFGSVPSEQQLAWQKLEMVGFAHFNVNTFTGNEWGSGHEDPSVFNPTALDCSEWARAFKNAGFKELIITAKHHDGFCLWPSAYTDHCVKNSPWKNGKGDVLREFSEACAQLGIKCGLYLSPWDRNSAYYGDSPRYNQYYLNQLTEILTHYGDITEVWFDGACGEGPNGKIQEYDWASYYSTVAKRAPHAVMFNGSATSGRGVRFSGNEAGFAARSNWNHDGNNPNSAGWYPVECDVSIRPGWYYHPDQNRQIKSVDDLLDIYYGSVGRGAVLLLNVPPDRRGLISEADIARLNEFHAALQSIFARDLAAGKPVTATNVRSRSKAFSPDNLTSKDYDRYWATDDDTRTASFEVNLGKPSSFNNIVLQEYIPLGQRVSAFTVEALIDNQWKQIAAGTTIGYKRILWIPRVMAPKVRVNITNSLAAPVLTKFGLFNGPRDVVIAPTSLIAQKPATASNVHGNQTEFGPDKAVDGDMETRWATDDATSECWLQADAGDAVTMGKVRIAEFAPRIQQFRIEYKLQPADEWKVALDGTTAGRDYVKSFPPVIARFVRLHILKASEAPTIWEFQVFGPSLPPPNEIHNSLRGSQ